MFSRQERVEIFMSRFHGRRDVFARRWERTDGASGYAPVYADKTKNSYVTSDDDFVFIPRGFLPKLVEWLNNHKIQYILKDKKATTKPTIFKSKFELFGFQKKA